MTLVVSCDPMEHTKRTAEWVIEIEQKFKKKIYKKRESSEDVSIFKVPPSIRDFNPKAYNAKVVRLGPFLHSHDNEEEVWAADDHKLSALEATLRRLEVSGIDDLINIVMQKDKEIRDCYQDRAVELSEKALAWMMTIGACFIIEFFYYSLKKDFNLIFVMKDGHEVVEDIMKFENQIPLLVPKLILQLDRNPNAISEFASILSQWSIFKGYPFFQNKNINTEKIKQYITGKDARGNDCEVASHLLDLQRMVIRDSLLRSPSNSSSSSSAPSNSSSPASVFDINSLLSAEMLSKTGIKFEGNCDGKIEFKPTSLGTATLSLPQIVVEDNTDTAVRNLMALEECGKCLRPRDTGIISYYILVLDALINSKEDVALLRKGDVIRSYMGSDEEIAHMFNALGNGIVDDKYSPYDEELKRVMEHHNNSHHKLIGKMKEWYDSQPWPLLIVSFVIGALILGMTTVQTTFSVKNK